MLCGPGEVEVSNSRDRDRGPSGRSFADRSISYPRLIVSRNIEELPEEIEEDWKFEPSGTVNGMRRSVRLIKIVEANRLHSRCDVDQQRAATRSIDIQDTR